MDRAIAIVIFINLLLTVFASSQNTDQITHAQNYFDAAQKLKSTGQDSQAILQFQKAYHSFSTLADHTGMIESLNQIGYLYLNLRAVDSAVVKYSQSADLAKSTGNLHAYARALDAISTTYFLKDRISQAIPIMRECLTICNKISVPKIQFSQTTILGYAYFETGVLDSAQKYLTIGLEMARQNKDTSGIALAQNYLGRFYHIIGDIEKSKDQYFEMLSLREAIKDTLNIAAAYQSISRLFLSINDYDNAEKYVNQALAHCDHLRLKTYKANSQALLASIYEKQGKVEAALELYEQVSEVYRSKKNEDLLTNSLLKMGQIYLAKGRNSSAEKAIKEALQIVNTSKNVGNFSSTKILYGELLMSNQQFRSAEIQLLDAAEIAENKNNILQVIKASKNLSTLYDSLDNPSEALRWYKKYQVAQDSALRTEQQKAIYEMDTRYRVSQKEKQIALLNVENDNRALKLKLAKRRQYLMGIGLAALAAFGIMIYLFYRTKKQDNLLLAVKNETIGNALKDKELLLREIQHRVKNNLQVISSILSIQSFQSDDPDVQNAVREGKDRVKSMSLIHESLYRNQNLLAVDAEAYIEKLANLLFESYHVDRNKISLDTAIEPLKLDVDIMIPLGLILNELLSNTLKYAFQDTDIGNVSVAFQNINDQLILKVNDNGKGLPKNFDVNTISSTGWLIIKDFCAKLKGEIMVDGSSGTIVNITIPYLGK